ncbi:S46 family peptidase [Candidatus Neomarinimicrobiota bacterium]
MLNKGKSRLLSGKRLISLLIIVFISGFAIADEGMWTIDQIDKLDLEKKGLKIPLEEVYNPDGTSLFNAIVRLGGGTSEFVSPNGLILTNHHVAYGAVQKASTQGVDYLTNGFLANSLEEEFHMPGTSAMIIDEIHDVTEEVIMAGAKIKDLVKHQRAINVKIKAMTDAIEEGQEDVIAKIASMYEGQQYLLYIYKRFDDVRIVYMPPMAIGNYGADIDNWMWPRHTGDFAFARVYVSPEGVGRKYDPENIPYHPKKWLKISTRDLNDGDFTMIMGFPGKTSRYRTSSSIKYNREFYYPDWLDRANDVIKILDKAGEDSPEAKMAVAGMRKGRANYQKKFGGTVVAMDKFNYLQNTLENEKKFKEYVNSNRKLKKKYGKIIENIEILYDDQKNTKKHDDILSAFSGTWMGTLPTVANNIYTTAKEREKTDLDRDPNFSEKDVKRTAERLHYRYMDFYEPAHRELFRYYLDKAYRLPINNRIKGIDEFLSKNNMTIDEFVDYAFKNTKLTDVEYTKTLYAYKSDELEKLNDPFIDLARAIYNENEILLKRNEIFNAEITELRKNYMEALQLMSDETFYPDANSSFRFTYGDVEGYKPRDAVQYAPFTTLGGAIEKDTGVSPFDVPAKLKELYKSRDYGNWADPDLNDIPIAFLHSTDITNGNSGSPVLNAWGEMIGIAFDGNLEAMLSDWKFDPAIQRTISVDIRYVMFVTEKYAGADFLLEEMGLK